MSSPYQARFQQIFGGLSGKNVRDYLDTGMKYFVSEREIIHQPPEFKFTGWFYDPNYDPDAQNEKLISGASNVGMALWFQGLLEGFPILFLIDGKMVPIGSPHIGIIELGKGYAPFIVVDKKPVSLPSSYRHGLLVHERRHGFCTGGLTEKDLENARSSRSASEFEMKYKNVECGHFHTFCPSGDLQGLAVCDARPWGAYAIGWLYAVSQIAAAQTLAERELLTLAADDFKYRLAYDRQLLLNHTRPPDMSNLEIIKR